MATSALNGTGMKCTVCLDNFKDPKVLPCCHTFCKKCLEGILRTNDPSGLRRRPGRETGNLGGSPRKRDGLSSTVEDHSILVGEASTTQTSSLVSRLSCPQCRKKHDVS